MVENHVESWVDHTIRKWHRLGLIKHLFKYLLPTRGIRDTYSQTLCTGVHCGVAVKGVRPIRDITVETTAQCIGGEVSTVYSTGGYSYRYGQGDVAGDIL